MFNRNVLVTNVIVALGANAITVLEPTLPAVLDGTIVTRRHLPPMRWLAYQPRARLQQSSTRRPL
jgi:hypothetical protein